MLFDIISKGWKTILSPKHVRDLTSRLSRVSIHAYNAACQAKLNSASKSAGRANPGQRTEIFGPPS